jgi:hypothetical protein
MNKSTNEIDIILDILKKSLEMFPDSVFLNSLFNQYRERGSLSKKQLEGLHSKASKIKDFPVGKLATLQAIILRKPNRYKSEISMALPIIPQADTNTNLMVEEILNKYPQHKRVLYFKMKMDKKDILTALEHEELKKFHKLIM